MKRSEGISKEAQQQKREEALKKTVPKCVQ